MTIVSTKDTEWPTLCRCVVRQHSFIYEYHLATMLLDIYRIQILVYNDKIMRISIESELRATNSIHKTITKRC